VVLYFYYSPAMTLPEDPPGELGECLRIERRIDAAFTQAWSERMDRRQGVCLSGFDPRPPARRSEARLRADARRRLANRRAWRRSPAGRLQRLSEEAAALAVPLPAASRRLQGPRAREAAAELALAARRLSRIAGAARRALERLDPPPE
jgi:hypothetical protein